MKHVKLDNGIVDNFEEHIKSKKGSTLVKEKESTDTKLSVYLIRGVKFRLFRDFRVGSGTIRIQHGTNIKSAV